MDNVLGIVSEYNPFHNGHLYHLNKSKEITGSKYCIAVMSGNFTQRGETSIINKWDKANLCIENGVDLVIELPTIYSISSSENFASGAIKILNSLNIVNHVSFGIEDSNIDRIMRVSNVLLNEPEEFKKILKENLSLHKTYPNALESSIEAYLGDSFLNVFSPNNTLAIEYLKSLNNLNSLIKPISIKRIENNYNDKSISAISSATAIRDSIKRGNIEILKNTLPENSFLEIKNAVKNGDLVTSLSMFESEILYKLRTMSKAEISNIPDVSNGLENKIKESVNITNCFDDLIKNIKSKQYTMTRIYRILLYCLLNISKADMQLSKEVTPYSRVLGFNENGKKLLSKIKKYNPNINLITSLKAFETENKDPRLQRLLDIDKLSTDIYSLKINTKFKSNQDYTIKL